MITTWLNWTDCLPQYAISDDMVCTGRISGLDITDNGSTITIGAGSAYVKTTDASGFEMNVKVYLDTDETVTKANNSDIIILVPLANVQNAQNNTDFSNIASLDVVPTSTGWDFHLVLATINWSGVVSDIVNAGHYLPWCDFCLRCEGGALQLPNINANDATFNDVNTNNINANDITATGQFNWDASGLFNLPNNLDTIDVLLWENVSQGDYLRIWVPISENIVVSTWWTNLFDSNAFFQQSFTSTYGGLVSWNQFQVQIWGNGWSVTHLVEIYDASNNLLGTCWNVTIPSGLSNQTFTLLSPTTIPAGSWNYIKFTKISWVAQTRLQLNTWNVYTWWNYSSWGVPQLNNDIVFDISIDNWETSNRYYRTDASNSNTIDWVWVAEISWTSWSTISMVYSPSDPFQTGLTIWDTMYLSDTPWEVSNTPWTNESQVWSVISSTEILFYRNPNAKSRTSILNNVTYTANKDWTVNALTISNTSSTPNLEWFVNWWLVSSATSITTGRTYSISFEVLKWETYRVNFNGLPVTYASFIS